MEGAYVGFGAFKEADFFIEGQVAFALSIERDTRGLGMRPCPVFNGIDQLTPHTPALCVGTDADHAKVVRDVSRVGRFARLVVAVEPRHGFPPKPPLNLSMVFC